MPVRYEIPADVHYSCTMCGDCCRRFDVLLGPGERERVEALEWGDSGPALGPGGGTMPSANPAIRGGRQLARRADGACVFLGERNQCLIHERFGEDAKPLMCRMYPFAFYRFGDRVGVEVAFSCNAVSTDRGEDVARKVPEWVRMAFGDGEPRDDRRHFLRPGVAVGGDLVWEIEFHLVQFLKNRALSFQDRVRACAEFLDLGTTGDPAASTAKMFRDAIAEGIPRRLAKVEQPARMDATQRAVFFLWLYLHLNPRPATFHLMPQSEQADETARLAAEAEAMAKGEGRPRIDGREIDADFDAVARVDASIFATGDTAFLEKFFATKILGKKYLMRTGRELPLVEGAGQLLMFWPMIVWTAKALAADRGAARVEDADVRRAVRALDHKLGVIDLSDLDKQRQEAVRHVFEDTKVVVAAANEVFRA